MSCYSPMLAYRDVFEKTKNGKSAVKFLKSLSSVSHERLVNNVSLDDTFLLPCSKCVGCRLKRSREWALRCVHEACMHEENCFITLTYSNENLPENGTLVKKHFQDFMKRLRKFAGKKIRFYSCGEYGERFQRPHYHAIIFGYDFKDKKYFKDSGKERLYISKALSKLWKFGFSTVGDVSFESAGYVARYCTKKISGKMASEHYKDRIPEYSMMSLKPGIGADWYRFYRNDVFPDDFIVARLKGNKFIKQSVPTYYSKLYEIESPYFCEKVKEKRKEKAQILRENWSFQKMNDKRENLIAKFKRCVRSYEKC